MEVTEVFYPQKGIHPKEQEALLAVYRQEIEAKESAALSPHAALSSGHWRPFGREDDHRLPYKRDVDRIVHSKAFARYADKTQVVYLVDNDHITHRSLHVQLVSNFARGIAEILGLNTDLVEAIALGHDVGHPPFGHEGEGYLSALSREYGEGSFSHPWQSCRLFREVEPLNLGLAVYDGFLCHDGGMREHTLKPRKEKSWEEHLQDLERKHQAPGRDIQPGTLEGCLVKLCDTMSYLGRDIEDAISLGVIHREQIPLTQLGSSNREFLAHIAADIIRNSRGKDYIAVSETTFAALKTVRAFNFKHIYSHAPIKAQSPKVKRSYRILFEYLLKDLEQAAEDSYIWTHFIHNKPEAYRQETRPARLVIDFIAGMTDGYFVKTLERLIVPQRIDLL